MKESLTYFLGDISLYETIDILLKLIAGIILVLLINKRNNRTKKQELLYDLFLKLVECHQEIQSNTYHYIRYVIYYAMYRIEQDSEHDLIVNYLLKESKKNRKKKLYVSSKIDEFLRIKDTIELILGRNNKDKKWNDLITNSKGAINLPTIINHERFEKMKMEIITNLNNYRKGLISFNEVESMNDSLSDVFFVIIQNEIIIPRNRIVRNYISELKKRIDNV